MSQSAEIINIQESTVLRTGDKANVTFRFVYNSVYIKKGNRLVFREGKIRGIGEITELIN